MLTSWIPSPRLCWKDARYVKNAEKTQERLQHAIELMNLGGDDEIHDQQKTVVFVGENFFADYCGGNIDIMCMYRYI